MMGKKKREEEERSLKYICSLFGSQASYEEIREYKEKYGYVPDDAKDRKGVY